MAQAPSQIDRLLADAIAARRAGRLADETELLARANAIAPADPRVVNARGMQALAAGRFDLARSLFVEAAGLDPAEAALQLNVATACRNLGDDAGERRALEAALNINRLNFMAVLRLAELCERRGENKEAARNWANVVQMALGLEERPPVVADALARGQAFLATHNAALDAAVEERLGDRLAALGPDARRFRRCLDVVLGRASIYGNQCQGVHYPFLPADEFFDRRLFPWLADVEARTGAIRAEALALLADPGDALRPYVRMEAGTPASKWSALDQSLDWGACFLWEYGERNDPVCAACPETAAMLDSLPRNHVPGKAPSAFFSILKAGAHIPPHTGVTNTRAIVHLPLVVPPGCAFRVGGETREWREGEAFAFDDTIEHEAWNRSPERRIVLIFDVWNPHLSEAEQGLLSEFFAVTNEA